MAGIAKRLSDEDSVAVAGYYQQLRGSAEASVQPAK
jgi:cytochrome c553